MKNYLWHYLQEKTNLATEHHQTAAQSVMRRLKLRCFIQGYIYIILGAYAQPSTCKNLRFEFTYEDSQDSSAIRDNCDAYSNKVFLAYMQHSTHPKRLSCSGDDVNKFYGSIQCLFKDMNQLFMYIQDATATTFTGTFICSYPTILARWRRDNSRPV